MVTSPGRFLIFVWESNISREKICIIANGESVMNNELGQIIDAFPVVGRINNYSTAGYEKYIGSHTHIWFNGANQNLKKRKKIPAEVVVFIPVEILKEKGESIHHRIQRRLGVSRDRYEMPDLRKMMEYERICGVSRPTTGTTSILWAMENFNEVIIHGYDFFIASKAHYNDHPIMTWLIQKGIVKKGHKHNMRGEKQFVESLIRSGKIKTLESVR